MADEITRKFLVKTMPDLSGFRPSYFERYYIFRDSKIELRIQQNGDKYELERKEIINKVKSLKSTMQICKQEFEKLKALGSQAIFRDMYIIHQNPEICIMIYHGRYEGLVRVEIDFVSEEEAASFTIPDWYGKEITDSIVSRDSKLLDISNESFKMFLNDNI